MPSTASSTWLAGTWKPAFSTACTRLAMAVLPSVSRLAWPVARLTLACCTPATLPSTRSKRATQEAQVMPTIGRVKRA